MTEPTDAELRTRYKERLLAELEEIAEASRQTSADRDPVVLDQQSVGRLSRMDAMQGQAMAAAMQWRRDGRIKAIHAALERLEIDEFGWCDDCGDFIGLKRLDLDPVAQRCVGCAR